MYRRGVSEDNIPDRYGPYGASRSDPMSAHKRAVVIELLEAINIQERSYNVQELSPATWWMSRSEIYLRVGGLDFIHWLFIIRKKNRSLSC